MDQKQKSLLIRKLLHLALLVPLGVHWVLADMYTLQWGLYALLGFLLAGVAYEFLRLETGLAIPFSRHVKQREERYHVDGLNLLIAILLVNAMFDPRVALSVSFVAILGDVVSTLGRLYGTMSIGPRTLQSWEGVIAAFVVDAVIFGLFFGPVWYVGLLAGGAVIIENILSFFDDNLVVPLVVGTLAEIILLL